MPARWWMTILLYGIVLAAASLLGIGCLAGWPGVRRWWGGVDMAPTATVAALLSLAGLMRHLWQPRGGADTDGRA